MEVREVIDKDVPTAKVKYGYILLRRNFILYRLNIKQEHPNTVSAKDNAKTTNPRKKQNVLNVSHEKLIINIQERDKSITLFGNFKYLEEKRVNPNTNRLKFKAKTICWITAQRIKQRVKKIPSKVVIYAIIKTKPIDLMFGKKEYTIKNNPITKISIEIVISNGSPIEVKYDNKNKAFINDIGNNQKIDTIFQNLNNTNIGINRVAENITKNKFLRIRSVTNTF